MVKKGHVKEAIEAIEAKEQHKSPVKPKGKGTAWTRFCTEYYAKNKQKFNGSFKKMLQSPELKSAYAASKK